MPHRYSPEETIEKFFEKIDKNGPWLKGMDSPCWIWFGCRGVYGYGHLGITGTPYRAHRFAYFLHYGHHVPKGMCALHRCDNPCCVNPEHLFIGTQADNVRDMEKKGRKRVAVGDANGSRKHIDQRPRGEQHGRTKLTEKDVLRIRSMEMTSKTVALLAKEYGITQAPIRAIIQRKTWKHI